MTAAMVTTSACSSRDDTASDGGVVDAGSEQGANDDVTVDGGASGDTGGAGDGSPSDNRSGDSSSSKCPPDLNAPIEPATCTSDRTAIDDKISARDRQQFESEAGPFSVLITARDGATICTLVPCPGTPCPEQEAVHNRWMAENLASQRCVREWLTAAGATVSSETFWIVNAFEATLTWEQIKGVAAYPHVVHVESNSGAPPP